MKELYCHQKMITVIDGMAVVQAMGKPSWIKACAQWADHFTAILDSKCSDCDKVHLVFDRYDPRTSLKQSTRERRQGGKPIITYHAYHVTDNTPVGKVSAKQFLSSTTTKDELYSSQEEADTRIMLHSLDAARRGATELYIQSSDTDVFVLAIHRYHQLCKD